ncbi:MAG: cbb3-type cytochrome oxidase assembly protein CcoS [Myxococcales bacterium]|nr:cbb3-type cytochrome oxidase assembly protein CcoS [Myxococcales bacterium]
MNVIVLQIFVSLLLVGGSLVLFVHSVRQRDFDHGDRLSLAPLEDDVSAAAEPPPTPPSSPSDPQPSRTSGSSNDT